MEPVDPIVQELQTKLFHAMSAGRKLALVDELIDLARALKTSSLRTLHPELSEEELRGRVAALFANVAR
ncbi:MAG: hypothetical protein HOP28_08430 [Gemmatimonadales bacterium]|nr:hypothetical protein [Gemmatimonadales bacterium]